MLHATEYTMPDADDRLGDALGQLALATRHRWLAGPIDVYEYDVEKASEDLGDPSTCMISSSGRRKANATPVKI